MRKNIKYISYSYASSRYVIYIYYVVINPPKNLTNAVSLFNAQIVKITVTQKAIVLTRQVASTA
jgi:hypothetical protein